MQELRSTDILDKEIQADARKKAERMLQKTDRECEQLLASVESDLEKARFKVTFIQNAIIQNINKYLEGLTEEKKLELVSRTFDFKSDLKLNAYVYGFSLEAAKKFLLNKMAGNLLSCKETKFGALILEEDIGLAKPEGIILESEDKSYRCRLTLNEVIEGLLNSDRAELSSTLFGGDL